MSSSYEVNSMIKFGKFKGTCAFRLLVAEPAYVRWVLAQEEPGRELRELSELLRDSIRRLDSRPFVTSCRCGNSAKKASAYISSSGVLSPDLQWWCEECDIGSHGALLTGHLRVIGSYSEAIELVRFYSGDKRKQSQGQMSAFARKIFMAKGLKGNATSKAIAALLGRPRWARNQERPR